MTSPSAIPPVLLVGGGRMGSAMMAGWQEAGLEPSFAVDPALPALGAGVAVVADAGSVPLGFRPGAVVLAVKPQAAAEVAPLYARWARDGAVVLSIMAGRTLPGLRAVLGEGAAVVRAMPNTPAAIGQGITVAVAGPGVSTAQRGLCDTLLRAAGAVEWVEDEALMDAVTAVSGSGPAYVFLLAELLAEAAVAQGIPPGLAARLARHTVAGSGAMLARSAEPADALRRAVTSPGGTTERALGVLMAEWPAAVERAVDAATRRSRELSG